MQPLQPVEPDSDEEVLYLEARMMIYLDLFANWGLGVLTEAIFKCTGCDRLPALNNEGMSFATPCCNQGLLLPCGD